MTKKTISPFEQVYSAVAPRLKWIYAAVLFILFIGLHFKVFDPKVDQNGDNVAYFILAQSMVSGEGYTNIHQVPASAHHHYPPGYPALLAFTMQFFSDSIPVLKRLNSLFFLLSLFLMFQLTRTVTSNLHIAFITTLLCLINMHLLRYSVIMMSELSFLLVGVLSITLLLKVDFSKALLKNSRFALLIVVIGGLIYIKTLGVALLVGALAYLTIRRYWQYAVALLLGVCTIQLPWWLRNAQLDGNSYLKQLILVNPYRPEQGTLDFMDFISRIGVNLQRYLGWEIPYATFNFFSTPAYGLEIPMSKMISGLLLLSIALYGLLHFKKQYRALFSALFLSYFCILLVWPEVWYGVRFMLGLLPFFILLIVYGTYQLLLFLVQRLGITLSRSQQATLPLLALVVVPLSLDRIDLLEREANSDYNPAYLNYFRIARWVGTEAPPDAIVACRKGGLFHLFSGKRVTGFRSTNNSQAIIEDFKAKGVDYVVIDQLGFSSTRKYLIPAVDSFSYLFEPVLELPEPSTYLLKFQPDNTDPTETNNTQN